LLVESPLLEASTGSVIPRRLKAEVGLGYRQIQIFDVCDRSLFTPDEMFLGNRLSFPPKQYDIMSLEPGSRQVDEAGIVQSRQMIRTLIARENQRGIPSRRIFLAGFSQGGAIAYTAALTHPEPLAGVIALSTYLPSQRLLAEEATEANRATPIFAAHGTADDVVAIQLGLQARDYLKKCGYMLEWHEYPMPHSICLEEIELIGEWLRTRMAAG
jgi:phospholipase/carboxylesterase